MTPRNLVSLFIGLLLSLAGVQGAMANTVADPGLCPTTGTYQDLLNTNLSGGCVINVGSGGSLLFTNFAFTKAGVGTPNAAAVGYTLDDPGLGPSGQQIFGFEFDPGLSVTGVDAVQDILLTYRIVPVGTFIVSDDLLENAAATGSGVGEVTEDVHFCIASDPNNTSGTCRIFSPLFVTTAIPNDLEDDKKFGKWTSMTVSKDISAFTGLDGGTASISQVRDAVDVSSVPEPTTYGLLSIGLLTIGYFSRRRCVR